MQMIIEKRNPFITKPVIMEEMLELTVARVNDKSPFVRKAALSLLQTLIEYFFNVYKVTSKSGHRLLTQAEAERK